VSDFSSNRAEKPTNPTARIMKPARERRRLVSITLTFPRRRVRAEPWQAPLKLKEIAGERTINADLKVAEH
ncbi:hypothetical protein, partial [Pseudomonas umsongensis]|uniref:hypothetical protein n=1 Tax=Pseudomonas umsongensis TaxID=198618 RepID=UPI00200AF1FE